MTTQQSAVGVVFGSITPPEVITDVARQAEDLGFDELWFSEDCFYSGAMAGTAQILAATRGIPVGVGAVSAVTRHPAVTAMEFAGLARTYPGRVRAGVALGGRGWLDQMGLLPRAPLATLRETAESLRHLLAGEEVTLAGSTHRLTGIRLDHPPAQLPPIHIGAVNEKALRLSGEIADGTILSVLGGPAYVRWARRRIDEGRAISGRTGHRITSFALYSVDRDRTRARDAVRESVALFLAAEHRTALAHVPGIADEVAALLADGSGPLSRRLPDSWLDELAIAGDPDECTDRLQRLFDAGADAVGLWLLPTSRAAEVAALTAREVLPGLDVRRKYLTGTDRFRVPGESSARRRCDDERRA